MKRLKVKQVDVFTRTPFRGNPAAVVLDADGLNAQEMQAIAREMNLSETTFVLPPTRPDADYRVRIFTPKSELPFAGHPTIATVHAILEEGRIFNGKTPSLVGQECGIGIVPIAIEQRADGPLFMMTQAEPQWLASGLDQDKAAEMLGCSQADIVPLPLEIVSTGVKWLVIPLKSLESVKSLRPNMGVIEDACKKIGALGVTLFCLEAQRSDCTLHARTFAPGEGVLEDPVCGSGNGSIAAYIAKHNLLPGKIIQYLAEQGLEIERPGTVSVKTELQTNGKWVIQVGGQAVTVLEGDILF